ncbi:23S rRNA (pseudouridine(1915)-N(3))-methyltransferase RlmH [Thermodesulfobacteriota bacterium]
MLKIRIVVVDRTKSPFIKEGEAFYLKRLKRYTEVVWSEIKPAKITKRKSPAEILALEAQAVTKKIGPEDRIISLDRSGSQFDSLELAQWLEKMSVESFGRLSFLIGGPLGISEGFQKRSYKVLSLSKLTLTHEMSRLVLLEQLYRAFTILRGEKYHK